MPQVEVVDRMLDGPHGPLRIRTYSPSSSTGHGVVWVHGGGFVAGDLDMPEADWVSRSLAEHGITVASVDYQLAPLPTEGLARATDEARGGVRYPVAHDEVVFAFRWAAGSGVAAGPWTMGGASAGGNLAAGAALKLARDGGQAPALLVLAYPTLHAVQDVPSPALRALLDADPDADRFGPDAVVGMYKNYLGGSLADADIFAVPGTATAAQLAGLPATIMINGETDELRVSGEAFARTLAAAGVDVQVSTEPGTTHGHLNRPAEAAAAASIDRFARRILDITPDRSL